MQIFTLADAKRTFFDRAGVIAAVSVAERSALSRFGAYVRQRARTSIKPRTGTSAPGAPPFSHVGLLRQFILFAYEPLRPLRGGVLIGAVKLGGKAGDVPRLLEHGGTAQRLRHGKLVRCDYRPRPFMQPAFERELSLLPPLWRDAIR